MIKKLLVFIGFSLFGFLAAVSVFSCNEKAGIKKSENELGVRKKRLQELDTLNAEATANLVKNRNAIADWNPEQKEWFTYHLQEYLDSSRPLTIIGEIKDIIKKDSLYILKIKNSKFRLFETILAEVSMSAGQFSQFKIAIKENFNTEGCFIFRMTKASSFIPVLTSEAQIQSPDDATSDLVYDFNERLIKLEGRLETYYIFKTLADLE